jgi:hypothetical protein
MIVSIAALRTRSADALEISESLAIFYTNSDLFMCSPGGFIRTALPI